MTEIAEQGDQDTALFDGKEYRVAFPRADGKEVTSLVLRLSGSLKLDRHDAEHAAFVESLELGRYVVLTVTASVDGKSHAVREGIDGTEVVTHSVALRIHEAEKAA